jgi:hypothetical protein
MLPSLASSVTNGHAKLVPLFQNAQRLTQTDWKVLQTLTPSCASPLYVVNLMPEIVFANF